MSAIAFYDSGRLLPYRHDLKQKQIEQRNIDAENTRKYIGYAGGAFANMAERTGTIFGARLGKAPTTTDATGKTVDAAQPYGGGTVGAEYAKADWQKGVMDDENHRRKVTHKLGLLTENVKYSTLRRKHEAWGGIDDKAAQEQFDNRWDQYHLDAKDGTMTKAQLIQKYHDFFDPEVFDLVKEYNAKDKDGNYIQDEDTRAQLLEGLNQFSPYSRWLKYAEENKLYDPTVAGKPRPEVDLLMAFLKDEVKFPGINEMLANRDDTKDKQKLSTLQQEQQKNPTVTLLEQLLKKREEVKTVDSSGSTTGGREETDWTFAGVAEEFVEAFKPSTLLKKSKQVAKQIVTKPTVPDAIDFDLNVLPDTLELEQAVIKHDGNRSLADILNSIPTVTVGGDDLTIVDKSINTAKRYKDAIMYKLKNKLPFYEEPTDQQLYGGVTKVDRRTAGEITKAKIKELKNREVLKLRISGKDGGELSGAWNKIENAYNDTLAFIETHLLDDSKIYKEETVGGLEHIEKSVAALNIGTFDRDSGEKIQPDAMKASMISSAPIYKIDPASLSSEQQKQQAYAHTLKHEDPNLTGRVIDDNKRAILGGSVDAWGIVGGDIESGRNVIMDVLKIKNPAKMRAFIQYFNTKDLDEHLGHIKKGKPALTPTQLDRRRLLKLTPDQTKALVRWAYDKNLNTLTNSHGFLNQEVYSHNPSLHQLLGDMAYRHGGSFMATPSAGYSGLANAIDYALNPTKEFSRADAIKEMNRLLFKQGTYNKKSEQGNARYAFLQDRFNRFKDNTAGVNVAATPSDIYKGGMTLVDGTPKLKNFNPLYNSNRVNPSTLRLPELTLTGL